MRRRTGIAQPRRSTIARRGGAGWRLSARDEGMASVEAKAETLMINERGGSRNLNRGDKWIADLTAAMLAASRRQDEQATTPEPPPRV